MHPLDAVLKLRPTNAASRLRGHRVCVLNARDVQRSLADWRGPLVVFDVGVPGLMGSLAAGVLRAARQLDAAVGLAVPAFPRGEGPAPYALFGELVAAAEEARYELPMFLRAGPLALDSAEGRALAAARESVFRWVDAGFTQIALDLRALDASEAAAALVEVAAPLAERELGVELLVPGAEGAARAEELLAAGVSADVVCFEGDGPADLGALSTQVAPAVLAWSDPSTSLQGARALRRVNVSSSLRRLAERLLPPGGEPDGAVCLKVEAHAWSEALEQLDQAKARGSATVVVDFLAEKSGY